MSRVRIYLPLSGTDLDRLAAGKPLTLATGHAVTTVSGRSVSILSARCSTTASGS